MDSAHNELNRETGLKEYELAFVANAREAQTEVRDALTSSGASISYEHETASVRLAYPIRGTESGFFGFCYFSADPSVTEEISRALTSRGSILRFLIISPPVKTSSRPAYRERAPREPVSAPLQAAPEGRVPSELSNELLEQKIEEILK